MFWFMVLQVVATLVELVQMGCQAESEKHLEILLLRRQLAIYARKQDQPMRLSRGEKLTLVVLGTTESQNWSHDPKNERGYSDCEIGNLDWLAQAVGPT